MKKLFALLLSLVLIFSFLTGCVGTQAETNVLNPTSAAATLATSATQGAQATQGALVDELQTSSTEDDSEQTAVIQLGNPITVTGSGAQVNGSTVLITAGGTYTISGTLANGQINVDTLDSEDKVKIKLNGVTLTNPSGPALLITNAKKVTLKLIAETTNTLSDAKNSNENDAAIFTNDTLVIEGKGTLIVNGNNVEGISSDDDIIINGGTIRVTSVDDGINAHDDITINDGTVYVMAGGDGIDSNGTINLTGGLIISQGSTAMGDGGVDSAGVFNLTGGTLIATGNTDAAPSSASTQYSIFVSSSSNQAAGTLFHIEQNGNEIITFAPAKDYQTVLFSSNSLTEGATYQVSFGGTSSARAVNGLYTSGTYTPASGSTSLSATAAIVPAGIGQMGGPGGRGGGVRP